MCSNPSPPPVRYSPRVQWLRSFLPHINAPARLAAARLLGAATAGLTPTQAADLLSTLTATFQPHPATASSPAPATTSSTGAAAAVDSQAAPAGGSTHPGAGATAAASASASGPAAKFEEQEGSILAAGYVLAQCLTAHPAPTPSRLEAAAAALQATLATGGSGGSSAHLAACAAQALGLASLRGALPLPGWSEAVAATQAGATAEDVEMAPAEQATAGTGAGTAAGAAGAAAGAPAAAAAAATSTAAPAAASAAPETPVTPVSQVLGRLSELIADKDVKVAVRAVAAAGLLLAGHPGKEAVHGPLLKVLFGLSTSKAEEVQFAGEIS